MKQTLTCVDLSANKLEDNTLVTVMIIMAVKPLGQHVFHYIQLVFTFPCNSDQRCEFQRHCRLLLLVLCCNSSGISCLHLFFFALLPPPPLGRTKEINGGTRRKHISFITPNLQW